MVEGAVATMPFCPTCGFEYRAGITRCQDCGAELVDRLPSASPPQPPGQPEERQALLCTVIGEFHAKLVQEALRAQGIVSRAQQGGMLENPFYLTMMPPPIGDQWQTAFRIYVFSRDLPRARQVYDHFDRGGRRTTQ